MSDKKGKKAKRGFIHSPCAGGEGLLCLDSLATSTSCSGRFLARTATDATYFEVALAGPISDEQRLRHTSRRVVAAESNPHLHLHASFADTTPAHVLILSQYLRGCAYAALTSTV